MRKRYLPRSRVRKIQSTVWIFDARSEAENRHAVVQVAINAAAAAWRTPFDVDASFDLRGTRTTGDGRIQNPVWPLPGSYPADTTKCAATRRWCRSRRAPCHGQQVFQFDVDSEQVAHRVLVLDLVQSPHDRAPCRALREVSAAAIWPSIQSVRAFASLTAGRGFPFGGIVPVLSCSTTFSHFWRFSLSAKSCERVSTRKSPLGSALA